MRRWIAAEVTALFLICCAGLLCCRCQPSLPPEPPVTVVGGADASDASVANVCTHLVTVAGCAYDVPTCTAGLQALESQGINPVDTACMLAATTKAAARLCAGVGPQGCP